MYAMGGAGNRPSLSFYPLTLTTHYNGKSMCDAQDPKGPYHPFFGGNKC
jgi:hypothetical protein